MDDGMGRKNRYPPSLAVESFLSKANDLVGGAGDHLTAGSILPCIYPVDFGLSVCAGFSGVRSVGQNSSRIP